VNSLNRKQLPCKLCVFNDKNGHGEFTRVRPVCDAEMVVLDLRRCRACFSESAALSTPI